MEINSLPLGPPKLKIEYRDSEGESEIIAIVSDLDEEENEIYDLLYEGNEIWISLVSGEPLSKAMINYVITDIVENVCDDGYPLIIRQLSHSIMLRTDLDAAPFGIKAYKFYRKYLGMNGVKGIFGPSFIKRYEKIIRRQEKR